MRGDTGCNTRRGRRAPLDASCTRSARRPNFVKMAPVVAALERAAALHAADRPHGPALRRAHVGRGARRPRLPRARPLPRGRLRHPRRADREGPRRVREDPARRPAGRGRRRRRRELHARLRARRLEARHPGRALESGLRSGDWSMPEEVNRVLTDRLSDLLFTHSPEAVDNLASEGIDPARVHYVGNTMIDSLRRCETQARAPGGVPRLRPAPVRVHARDAPPAGERRRPHAARPDRRPR